MPTSLSPEAVRRFEEREQVACGVAERVEAGEAELRRIRPKIQLIFQDAATALNAKTTTSARPTSFMRCMSRNPPMLLIVEPGRVRKALIVDSPGLMSRNHQLFLGLVDSQVHNEEDIGNMVIKNVGDAPVRVRDVGTVAASSAPNYTVVTANGCETAVSLS